MTGSQVRQDTDGENKVQEEGKEEHTRMKEEEAQNENTEAEELTPFGEDQGGKKVKEEDTTMTAADKKTSKVDKHDDDIEKIRQRRLKAMQKAHQAKQEFIQKGHGEYKELPSEKGTRE